MLSVWSRNTIFAVIVLAFGLASNAHAASLKDTTVTGALTVTDTLTVSGTISGSGALLTNIPGSVNSLTPGKVPYASTPTILIDSTIYQDVSGNIGIGSSAPQAKLDVEGNVYFGGGNVGIGTAVPQAQLEVGTGTSFIDGSNPSVLIDNNLYVDGTVYGTTFYGNGAQLTGLGSATGWTVSGTNVYSDSANNVGIGSTIPAQKLAVDGSVYVNGNIGIGTTVPVTALNISGNGTYPVWAALSFGDGDTKIYETADDYLYFKIHGTAGWYFFDDNMRGNGAAAIPKIRSGGASITVPGYTFNGHETTGLGSGGSTNDLSLITKGSSRLYINSTGNVGIGTNTPLGKLAVVRGTTDTDRALEVDDLSYNPQFVVLNNGNVGVGTTAPQAKLEVGTGTSFIDGSNPSVLIDNNLYVDGTIYGTTFYGDGSQLTNLGTATGWTVSGNDIYNANSDNVGIGTSIARASLDVEGTVYIQNTGTDYSFRVNDAMNDGTPFVITSAGYVGVGSTSPGKELTVKGSIQASAYYLGFDGGPNFSATGFYSGSYDQSYATYTGSIRITPLFIKALDGNIGIGTISPASRLTIVGGSIETNRALEIDTSAYSPTVVVLNNGNVGVGTTLPQFNLEVGSGTDIVAGAAPKVGIYGNLYVDGTVYGSTFYGDGSQLTGLAAVAGWTVSGTNVYSDSANNVGIGSTVPRQKLDVDGSIYVSGNVGIGTAISDSAGVPRLIITDTLIKIDLH